MNEIERAKLEEEQKVLNEAWSALQRVGEARRRAAKEGRVLPDPPGITISESPFMGR